MAIARPGKIVCVGRNYREHAAELGNVVPQQPLLFLKPSTAVIGDGDTIVLPPESTRVEHEAEIAFVIGRRIRRVTEAEALAAAEQLKVRQRRRAAVVPGRPSQIDALPFAQQFGEHGKLGYGYGSGGARRDRAWAGQGNGDGENVEERVQAGARHPSI